jgi:hypothetical protein
MNFKLRHEVFLTLSERMLIFKIVAYCLCVLKRQNRATSKLITNSQECNAFILGALLPYEFHF